MIDVPLITVPADKAAAFRLFAKSKPNNFFSGYTMEFRVDSPPKEGWGGDILADMIYTIDTRFVDDLDAEFSGWNRWKCSKPLSDAA